MIRLAVGQLRHRTLRYLALLLAIIAAVSITTATAGITRSLTTTVNDLFARPYANSAAVITVRSANDIDGDITRLRDLITQTRQQLTQGNDTRNSLAAIGGELRVAEAEMLTRQEMLAAAAAQMETARIEANKQVRYLSLSIAPIPPDEATYPRAFQNTLVAFLVFSGIYLMLSLTASILREEVST